MDDKKADPKIRVKIHFGDKSLTEIVSILIDTKLSLWEMQNQVGTEDSKINYTTVNHEYERSVITE